MAPPKQQILTLSSSELKSDVQPLLPCRQWQPPTFISQSILLPADTAGEQSPQRVRPCHSSYLTVFCSKPYLFIFKYYLLGYLHEVHVSFLRGAQGDNSSRLLMLPKAVKTFLVWLGGGPTPSSDFKLRPCLLCKKQCKLWELMWQ